ncbi:hypothetical protein BH23CHL2_BH23CHL2_24010 [soil metagenome]
MKTRILQRRSLSIGMLVALLVSMVPFAGTAGNHEATRTPVAFTSTYVEMVDPGEEWVDAAGVHHIRGAVQHEEVSGDISGTVTITLDGDFEPVGECTEDSCQGFFSAWAAIEITGEGGGWKGTYIQLSADVEDEGFHTDRLILRGTGANAHQSIYAESVGGDENSITFEGVLSTMALPMVGLNTNVRLCADFEEFSFTGGFLSTGAIEGSGGASTDPLVAGSRWTHTYAVAATVTLSDEHGTVTIVFGGGAQDNFTEAFEASHFWGHFMILEGTGAYAELYGNGRVIGTAGGPNPSCASGFGVNFSMIGEAHYN